MIDGPNSPSLPNPGEVVQVVFTGKVDSVSTTSDDVVLDNYVRFTDGTLVAVGDDGVEFEVLRPVYRIGDVGVIRLSPVGNQYQTVFCMIDNESPSGSSWFTQAGMSTQIADWHELTIIAHGDGSTPTSDD